MTTEALERSASEDFFYGKVSLSASQPRRSSVGSIFDFGQRFQSRGVRPESSERLQSSPKRGSKLLKLSGKLFGTRRKSEKQREGLPMAKAAPSSPAIIAGEPNLIKNLPKSSKNDTASQQHPAEERSARATLASTPLPVSGKQVQGPWLRADRSVNHQSKTPESAREEKLNKGGLALFAAEILTPVESPFAQPPRTPDADEAPQNSEEDAEEGMQPQRSFSRQDEGTYSVALTKGVPVCEGGRNVQEGLRLVKMSSLSPQDLDLTPRATACSNNGILASTDAQKDCEEHLTDLNSAQGGLIAAKKPRTRASGTLRSEIEKSRSPSLLDKLNSSDIDSVRHTVAASREASFTANDGALAKHSPKGRAPQDSAFEIQLATRMSRDGLPGPASPGQTYKLRKPPLSVPTHRPFSNSVPRGGQSVPNRAGSTSSDAFTAPGVDIMKTAPVLESRSMPQCMNSASIPAGLPTQRPLQPSHSPKQVSASGAPSKRSSHDWAGLGRTQAALAQLEWQNRNLSHDAEKLRKRALDAEALVALMSDMEGRCAKLTEENDRLLRRLLMLLSPSDIKSMHRYDALLEQQMGDLARENSRLSDENDTLRKDVKLLKAKGGGCLMCKYLGPLEHQQSRN